MIRNTDDVSVSVVSGLKNSWQLYDLNKSVQIINYPWTEDSVIYLLGITKENF